MEPAMVKQIKDAVRKSEKPLLELGRLASIDQSQLSRFMRGERTITLPAAARLCEILGLALTPVTKRPAAVAKPTRKPRGRK